MCFHLFNGMRHLLWDAGWGFEISRAYATGWSAVVLSLVLTAAIWAYVIMCGGIA